MAAPGAVAELFLHGSPAACVCVACATELVTLYTTAKTSSTTACKDSAGNSVACRDEDGVVIPDQMDSVSVPCAIRILAAVLAAVLD